LAFDHWDVGKVAKDKAKKIEARRGVVPAKGLYSFAEELEQGRALHHLSLSLLLCSPHALELDKKGMN